MSCYPPDSEKYLAPSYVSHGSIEKVTGSEVEFYATGDVASTTAIIFIPDVFGWNAGRTRNLADWFGESGYYVAVPKLLGPGLKGGTDGDGYFPEYDNTNPDHTALTGPFIKSFTFDEVLKPKIAALTAHLKSKGMTKLHLIGFCWGVWVGTHVLVDEELHSSFSSLCGPHPSITIEERMFGGPGSSEDLVRRVHTPMLLFPCENDPDTYRKGGAIHTLLRQNLPQEGDFVVVDMPSVKHGYTVRGDISIPSVHEAVQLTLTTMLDFIKAH